MTHLPPVLADSSNALGRSRRASKRTTSGSIMSSMIATFVDTVKKSLPSKDLARYQSVPTGDNAEHESSSGNSPVSNVELQHKFSFFEYAVFVLLGVAMYVTIFIWGIVLFYSYCIHSY